MHYNIVKKNVYRCCIFCFVLNAGYDSHDMGSLT